VANKKRKAPKKTRGKPEKDVRGYIVRPLDPEKAGYVERGYLEGNDAMSAVPPDTRRLMRRALRSGKAKVTITEVRKPRGK